MSNAPRPRSTLVLLFAIGAIACAMTAVSARVLGAQASDRGALLLRLGSDTVVTDRFIRDGDVLTGSMQVKGQARVDYYVTLAPGNVVRSLTLSVFRIGAAATDEPAQRIKVNIQGDSAIVETSTGVVRLESKAGAIPLMSNGLALTELFTRRARAAGGVTTIPLFALSGGSTLELTATPVGTDSMALAVGGQEQRVKVDAVGHIIGGMIPSAGVEFLRGGPEFAAGLVTAAPAAVVVVKPDYSAPAGAPYTAEEVSFKGPNGITLGGTLTKPKNARGPLPAVVTITGSGQQDRDELIPFAGGIRLFRQVADTLGRRGIAVLRLDDRGIGASGGNPINSTTEDFADDIRAGLTWLRARPDIDRTRIALLGHSEGAVIAPMIAASDPSIKAIVLLAGTAVKGSDISKAQNRYIIDHDTKLSQAQRDSAFISVAAQIDSSAPANAWIKFWFAYDPAPAARRVKSAALVLQGATDRQVPQEQAARLGTLLRSGGNADVTVKIFPAKNHLFIDDPDGDFANYDKLKTNKVGADVLGTIADWLATKLAASQSR